MAVCKTIGTDTKLLTLPMKGKVEKNKVINKPYVFKKLLQAGLYWPTQRKARNSVRSGSIVIR